jgi:hypothetical protein
MKYVKLFKAQIAFRCFGSKVAKLLLQGGQHQAAASQDWGPICPIVKNWKHLEHLGTVDTPILCAHVSPLLLRNLCTLEHNKDEQ